MSDSDFDAFRSKHFASPDSTLVRIFIFPLALRDVGDVDEPNEASSVHVAWLGELKMLSGANEQL